jgi:hypothetical protein
MRRLFNSRPGTCVYGLALGCVVAMSGCNHGPAMAQVKGKVLYKDGSVPKGGVRVVRFEPTEASTAEIRKGASGAIESDGSFEVYTRKPGDGIYTGEYDVTFAVQKGPMDPTQLILPKYTNKATTPYKKITIDKNMDDLKFEIEPAAGAGG